MTAAIIPAMTRNTSAETMYINPSRLWSTVATHLPKLAEYEKSLRAAPAVEMGLSIVAISCLLKCSEIGDELIQLIAVQLQARHQASGFRLLRIVDPCLQVFRSVRHYACRESGTAGEMG